jgi:uncharacterized protein (UPF0332 family)
MLFSAARAALRHIDPGFDQAKTHTGVLRLFSKHVIKTAGLDPDLVRILSLTEGARLRSDYAEVGSSMDEAQAAIAEMETFLKAIDAFISPP